MQKVRISFNVVVDDEYLKTLEDIVNSHLDEFISDKYPEILCVDSAKIGDIAEVEYPSEYS